jgi:hypothetical protein
VYHLFFLESIVLKYKELIDQIILKCTFEEGSSANGWCQKLPVFEVDGKFLIGSILYLISTLNVNSIRATYFVKLSYNGLGL